MTASCATGSPFEKQSVRSLSSNSDQGLPVLMFGRLRLMSPLAASCHLFGGADQPLLGFRHGQMGEEKATGSDPVAKTRRFSVALAMLRPALRCQALPALPRLAKPRGRSALRLSRWLLAVGPYGRMALWLGGVSSAFALVKCGEFREQFQGREFRSARRVQHVPPASVRGLRGSHSALCRDAAEVARSENGARLIGGGFVWLMGATADSENDQSWKKGPPVRDVGPHMIGPPP